MTDKLDILDQIATTPMMTEGPRTPLRKFKGHLEAIKAVKEANPFDSTKEDQTRLTFCFTNVEVTESIEPYDFAIAELEFIHSVWPASRYGVLDASFRKLLAPDQSIKNLIGADLEMTYTEGHMLYDGGEKKRLPKAAWEVTAIEGMAKEVSAREVALAILDGKNVQDFNKAVLQDPTVRSDSAVQTSIVNKTFLKSVVEEGLVVLDTDGIYHRVAF